MADPTSVNPGTAPDLLRALGGGGGESPSAESMMQAILSAQSAPLYSSPWQQIGAAMAGYGAGVQGRPNPVVEQLLKAREQSLTTALKLLEMRQKIEERAQDQEKSEIAIYKDLLALKDQPEVQRVGVQGFAKILKRRGISVPDSFAEGLLTQRIPPSDLPALGKLIEIGAPLSVVQRHFPAMTEKDYQGYIVLSDNPLFREVSGLKTLADKEAAELKRDKETLDLLHTKYGIEGTGPQAQAIRKMAVHLFEKPFNELNDFQRKTVIDQFDVKAGDPAKLSDESSLRGQFLQQSKIWTEVRDAFARIQSVSQTPSPAGDIALIVGYMKLIDPSTGVREGEFATARNAASIPESIRAMYNQLVAGKGLLTHNQRSDFIQQAFAQFAQHRQRQIELEKEFQGIALRKKMVAPDIVPDLMGALRGIQAPPRSIRVRHKKTGRTGTWDSSTPLPPDIEVIQ